MRQITKRQRITLPAEPVSLVLCKAAFYLAAVFAYLVFFTSPWAMWSAILLTLAALLMVSRLETRLSARGVLSFSIAPIVVSYLASLSIEQSGFLCSLFGVSTSLRASESLFFGGLAFGLVFGLRSWGRRARWGTWFEGAVVCLAFIQLFATHRNGQLHEPRFFTDWVIINGEHSIQWWLNLFGILLVACALIMFTRVRRGLHLVIALLLVGMVLGGFYLFIELGHEVKAVRPLTLGGGQGGGKGENDGEGKGDGSSPSPNRPPTPVAVAVFHDDYKPEHGILYFRQQVLSTFDGVKLVSDSSGQFDQDVITRFPNEKELRSAATQSEDNHLKISTSMYLIDEHPTPPALTHAAEIAPLDNPAPQRFVAAYSVRSAVSAVQLSRYVGRSSIPRSWGEEEVQHYLATHDEDPRYNTLAEEITRDLPPRRSADPIYRAIAIKRYLEREGYYTLKVKHRSSTDPAASFLFGDLRGYCVHFAHSAAHLLRSQGIAARVALGYAVDARTRSNSSAVLITGDRAHAWPEIHIAGVGWVTFDIYPEESDEPAPASVSQSLESLFGEMARNQIDRGLKRAAPFPWRSLFYWVGLVMILLVLLGYLVSLWRTLRVTWSHDAKVGRLAYLVTLDRLAGAGLSRGEGESRERYAERLKDIAPGIDALTHAHLSWALGDPAKQEERAITVAETARQVRKSFARCARGRWIITLMNPFGWFFSR